MWKTIDRMSDPEGFVEKHVFTADSAVAGLEAAYARDESDEFVKATRIGGLGSTIAALLFGEVNLPFAHVAIDDHSRVAFSALHPDETGRSACLALLQALRYYAGLGIHFCRLLTDNGACYRSKRFQKLCRRLGLKHLRTKPYTPQTNGKAERFIQTALREWAYARSYDSSEQRAEHLQPWLHEYNWHRPHASLGYQPPISRLQSVNNLVGLHT